MATPKLNELARRLRELKDTKDALASQLKEVDAEITSITVEQMPALMDENGVERFTIEGVGSIYQQVEVYAYVTKDREQEFFSWLRENGNESLIREYVFPGTLKSFAKEQLENGVDLPDFIKAAKVPTAKLRRKS